MRAIDFSHKITPRGSLVKKLFYPTLLWTPFKVLIILSKIFSKISKIFSSEDYHEDVIADSDKSNSSKKGHKTMCGYEEKLASIGPKTRQGIILI